METLSRNSLTSALSNTCWEAIVSILEICEDIGREKKIIFFPNKGILLSRLQLRYVLLTESPIVFTLIQIVGYTCVKSILFAHLFGLLLCIILFLQQVLSSSLLVKKKKKSLDLVFRFSILGKPCSSCYNE